MFVHSSYSQPDHPACFKLLWIRRQKLLVKNKNADLISISWRNHALVYNTKALAILIYNIIFTLTCESFKLSSACITLCSGRCACKEKTQA
jgi:hypothetical protein